MTRLTVVGQGKLGFPVAAYYAERGATVIGLDVDPDLARRLNDGIPSAPEPGASEALSGLLAAGRYRATVDPVEAYAEAETLIVLVPLLAHGGNVDFGAIDAAVDAMAGELPPSALVIFETTLPVGTTRKRFAPRLAAQQRILVAHSPERVSSGRIWRDLDTYPKLVGGVDAEAASAATAFYRGYLSAEVRQLNSAEAAELAKLAETTYRDLNIAFANELARFADEWGADVTEVIDAANSQPYSHIHRPGVGVGGHCIPHYPYLLQASTSGSDLVLLGRHLNDKMPEWVVQRTAKEVGPLRGKKVHLLGISYRAGVKESMTSPVFPLRTFLEAEGAAVTVSDPFYDPEEVRALGLDPGEWTEAEIVILVTDHLEYRSIDWSLHQPRLFVDGRNVYPPEALLERGIGYLGIGR